MDAPSQLRFNPLNGRWVALAQERATRPNDHAPTTPPGSREAADAPGDTATAGDRPRCPFCVGNEDLTPPALATYPSEGPWQVRIVPNKYPAFTGLEAAVAPPDGVLHHRTGAGGAHEVLIIGPEHVADLALLDDARLDAVSCGLIDRLQAHAERPEIAYTQVIVNVGREAGASLEHPHAQLLGIPLVPRLIDDELRRLARFATVPGHERAGGCLLCATVVEEERLGERVVMADDRSVAIAPYWSGAPYEVLIVPRHHDAHLAHAGASRLSEAIRLLRDCLVRLQGVLGEVAYNVVVHTAPHPRPRAGSVEGYHWHIHLLPRTTTLAGFEQGTGVLINTVSPEDAARRLADRPRVPR